MNGAPPQSGPPGQQHGGQQHGGGQYGGRNRKRGSNGGGGGGPINRDNIGNRQERGRRSFSGFVGPMDHSYRLNGNGAEINGNSVSAANRFRGGRGAQVQAHFEQQELQPLPPLREDSPVRIYALVEDLFLVTKMQDIARKLNVRVEFPKSEKDLVEQAEQSPEKPSLVIVDLNHHTVKPLTAITKVRSKFKRGTSIVGFVSHIQGDLKMKATEAGCDVVMPRSAFSQNLPNLLRRHAETQEIETVN